MNIRKLIASVVGTLVAAVAVAGTAHAQGPNQFASINGGNGTFTYAGGTAASNGLTMLAPFYASLDYPTAGSTVNNPALVSFIGLANNGTVVTVANGDGLGHTTFTQLLTGGTFTIKNAAGTQTLLAGTYTGANLTGTFGTNSAGVNTNFQGVTYTGGAYASAATIALGVNAANSFNFSLLNVTPTLSQSGSYISNFTSAGNGQFTGFVTGTPEPGTYAAFAFTGLGVMGLMLRARKTRGSMGA